MPQLELTRAWLEDLPDRPGPEIEFIIKCRLLEAGFDVTKPISITEDPQRLVFIYQQEDE